MCLFWLCSDYFDLRLFILFLKPERRGLFCTTHNQNKLMLPGVVFKYSSSDFCDQFDTGSVIVRLIYITKHCEKRGWLLVNTDNVRCVLIGSDGRRDRKNWPVGTVCVLLRADRQNIGDLLFRCWLIEHPNPTPLHSLREFGLWYQIDRAFVFPRPPPPPT